MKFVVSIDTSNAHWPDGTKNLDGSNLPVILMMEIVSMALSKYDIKVESFDRAENMEWFERKG